MEERRWLVVAQPELSVTMALVLQNRLLGICGVLYTRPGCPLGQGENAEHETLAPQLGFRNCYDGAIRLDSRDTLDAAKRGRKQLRCHCLAGLEC